MPELYVTHQSTVYQYSIASSPDALGDIREPSGQDSMARLADDNMLFRDGRFRPITDRHHFASIRSGAKDAKFICPHARVSLEFRRKLNRILLTACKMLCKDMQTEPHGILYLRDRCE